MVPFFHAIAKVALNAGARFRSNTNGNIAIIFAFASVAVAVGVGAGIDLSGAFAARQRLSEVAALTCQYSIRESVVNSQSSNTAYLTNSANTFQTYLSQVNTFATTSLTAQHIAASSVVGANGGAYFTATSGSSGPTNGVTDLSMTYPTAFLKIINVTSIPLHARIGCQTATTATQKYNGAYILSEGFETSCTSYCDTEPSGVGGALLNPTTSFPSTPSYQGSGGFSWYVLGYCLEIDYVGIINSTDPEGTHSAELDCDNTNHDAGNSSISTRLFLQAGNYELRYNYRSRVDYPDYDPAYICGSTAADIAWANDTYTPSGPNSSSLRTNQINVYLDPTTSSANPPLHDTVYGLAIQQLAGSDVIDECVYSPTWLERSVKIKVTTAGYFWLSFAADGANDSFGGQLDNIRVCISTCPTSLQDNFPTAWLPGNNNGTNVLLFQDPFETSPLYSGGSSYSYSGGNLDSSAASWTVPGWPYQPNSQPTTAQTVASFPVSYNWATAPYNQMTFLTKNAYQGSQNIQLQNTCSGLCSSGNRSASRQFLLDPGYYQVSFDYISTLTFGSTPSKSGCTSAPSSGTLVPTLSNARGTIRNTSSTVTANQNTNFVGVFMSSQLLVSFPNPGSPTTAGTQTSYTNPSGTTSTTATSPPDSVSLSSYNSAQNNPLLDYCVYSTTWLPRTDYVEITKPGLYELTFSANGATYSGYGGSIDNVALTALGSLYMSNPPTTSLTAVPVISPQPGAQYTNNGAFSGFFIVADPLTPPVADQ